SRDDRIPEWDTGMDDRGWTEWPAASPEKRRDKLSLLRQQYESPLRDFRPGESSLEAFRELLTLATSPGIPAAVVLAPQGPQLRGLYAPDSLRRLVADVTELCRQQGVLFVNAFEWLGEEMFNDSIHPHTEGAGVFSRRLAVEVLLPALGGHGPARIGRS